MNKKLLVVFTLLIFNSSVGNCQTVFPSYTDNALWRSMICIFGMGFYCSTDSLYYDYDTTFCGHTYSRISLLGEEAYCRSDSLKTYVRTTANCSDPEFLMYDYSMNIGDTVHTGYNLFWGGDSAKMMLSSIDTVIYFGFARRRFHMLFNPSSPHSTFLFTSMTWIEGIGSDWNPFYPLYCLYSGCELSFMLLCYDSSLTQLYMNPAVNTCDSNFSTIGINEYETHNGINIFPNPATYEIRIKNNELRIESVEIYDVVGGKIKSLSPFPSPLREGSASIDVSGLAQGMYFVRIKTENGGVTKKFIKQ